jgi:hypothetical protein
MKGANSLIGSLGLSCRYKRLLSFRGCSGQPSTEYFFPHRTLFQFMFPQRPASWAAGCAGPLVSECVSPGKTLKKTLGWKNEMKKTAKLLLSTC